MISPAQNSTRLELARLNQVAVRDEDGELYLESRATAPGACVVEYDALTDRDRRTVHRILFGV